MSPSLPFRRRRPRSTSVLRASGHEPVTSPATVGGDADTADEALAHHRDRLTAYRLSQEMAELADRLQQKARALRDELESATPPEEHASNA